MERAFEGVWIPKEIWLSESLTLQEKVFYVEICSLDNDNGCYANNEYFSRFFGVSKTRVSEVINSLVEKGYLNSNVDIKQGNIRVLKRSVPLFGKVEEGLKEKLKRVLKNPEEGLKEKFKHNNTFNNTINNTLNIPPISPKGEDSKSSLKTEKENPPYSAPPPLNYPFETKRFKSKWELWKEYRKQKRKPIKGIIEEQSALMNISKLSNGNEETAIAIIQQSIDNGWQGLFQFKGAKKGITRDGINEAFSKYYSQREEY